MFLGQDRLRGLRWEAVSNFCRAVTRRSHGHSAATCGRSFRPGFNPIPPEVRSVQNCMQGAALAEDSAVCLGWRQVLEGHCVQRREEETVPG